MIDIDKLDIVPENITIVPTIIDISIEAPLEGKKAFEYIINQKYFNRPTNNIDYWINTGIPKPIIEEDMKAINRHNFNFSAIDSQLDHENIINEVPKNTIIKDKNIIIKDKKILTLLKLRK